MRRNMHLTNQMESPICWHGQSSRRRRVFVADPVCYMGLSFNHLGAIIRQI
jgi:hypothetical protein